MQYPDKTDLEKAELEASEPVPTSHPPAIWFFFWGEFAERSSYYGMRAILFLYMTKALHMATASAGPSYSMFKMACYSLPLAGGIIADRWLGRYWTIVGFSIPYVAGHFILGIPNETAMFIALGLLACGSGVIKPNISTLMGQTYDQLRPGQSQLRSAAFLWFYFAINVGALVSQLALPEIRQRYILAHLEPGTLIQAQQLLQEGKDISPIVPDDVLQAAYGIAFQFPAWLMVASLAIFAAGKRFYAVEKLETPTTPPQLKDYLLEAAFFVGSMVVSTLGGLLYYLWKGDELFAYAIAGAGLLLYLILSGPMMTMIRWIQEAKTPEEKRLRWLPLARLFMIFGLVVLFWFGYEHNDTLWVAFIGDYVNLKLSLPFISETKTIAPDQLQFINALFVLILIPVFNFLFAYFDPKGTIVTPIRKILAGFILTAAAVGIMSVAGFLAQGHTETVTEAGKSVEVCLSEAKVSAWWPVMAYIVLTFGEVLLYGTMLELAYTAAPKSMKGFVTACFLLTNTLGNGLNVLWTPQYGGALSDEVTKRGPLLPGPFFGITALVVVAAAVAFVFIGKQFERSQAEAAASGLT
jgi:POT family proton-dependent oligopeptide transporter